MARLVTCGFELQETAAQLAASVASAPDGFLVTSPGYSVNTTNPRSGAACGSYLNSATNTPRTNFSFVNGGGLGTDMYFRVPVRHSGLPTGSSYFFWVVNSSTVSLRLENTGSISLSINNSIVFSTPSGEFVANQYFVHEVRFRVGTGSVDQVEWLVDGVQKYLGTGLSITDTLPTSFDIGNLVTESGTAITNLIDDVAMNDSTGAAQNSWCGNTGKIILLKPATDSAIGTGWTLGTGTAISGNTGAGAIDNTPPAGVADLTAGSDTKQIRNATSNANVNYDTNLTTYTAAGLVNGGIVKVLVPIIATGAPVVTSAKAGTVGIVSNPAIANVALGAGGTAGAFWSGVAAGAYPTGWKWSKGTVTYSPSITPGTAPVMRVTQVTSSTRIAMVCNMAMYIEYVPPINYTESATISSVTSLSATEVEPSVETSTISSLTRILPSDPVFATVTDNFNRADNSVLGGSWVNRNGSTTFGIVSNVARSGTVVSDCTACYQDATRNDGVAYATISVSLGIDYYVLAREQGSISTDNVTGYAVGYDKFLELLHLYKIVSGTKNDLITSVSLSLTSGDKIAIRVYGDTIEAWASASGVWSKYLTVYDTSYSSGYFGIGGNYSAYNFTASLDNFGIESVVYGEIYTAGVSGTTNTDSATISSVTSVSSNDIAAYIDANTPSSKTSITQTDTEQGVDASTGASVTSITSTETAQFVESATISSVSSLSSVESHVISDSGTVSGVSSVISSDIYSAIDAATIAGATTPSSVEVHEIPDSSTISGTTTVTTLDTTQYVDSATVSGITTPSTADTLQAVESATINGITSVISSESFPTTDASTGATTTVVTSNETTQYVDATTVSTVNTPTSAETHAIPDSSTVSGTTSITTLDTLQAVEAATVATTASLTSAEVHEIPDSSTISGTTSITTLDTAQYVDAISVTGTTTPSSSELHEISDANTLTSITSITYTEVASYVESATVTGITTLQSIELRTISDSSTIAGTTTIVTSDIAAYIEAATGTSITTVTSNELLSAVDSATASGSTALSSSENAQYVDSATVPSTTTLTSSEQQLTPGRDSATGSTITTITSSDTAQFVESATLSGITTLSSTEVHGVSYSDSGTINSSTSIISADIANYVDSNTPSSSTSCTTSESGQTLESSTLTSITSLTYDEGQQRTFIDSATIAGATILSSLDALGTTDTQTVAGITYVDSTDLLAGLDSDTISSRTSLTATESKTSGNTDHATITSITYIVTTEYYKLLTGKLHATAIFTRWTSTDTIEARWAVQGFRTKWAAINSVKRWAVESYQRWLAHDFS